MRIAAPTPWFFSCTSSVTRGSPSFSTAARVPSGLASMTTISERISGGMPRMTDSIWRSTL